MYIQQYLQLARAYTAFGDGSLFFKAGERVLSFSVIFFLASVSFILLLRIPSIVLLSISININPGLMLKVISPAFVANQLTLLHFQEGEPADIFL